MSDPTIFAAVIGAGAALLGGALTLLGGIVVPLLSERLTNKAERRKMVRDKIEEMYILSNQVEKWASSRVSEIQQETNGDRLRLSIRVLDNPIDRLEMLIRLYIPSLKTSIVAYLSAVNDLSKLYAPLKPPPDPHLALPSLDEEFYRIPTQEELKNILHAYGVFEEMHNKLQTSLENLALKN